MKTQEEIEAMANDFVSLAFSKQDLYDGFINGYTQCQEDMADEIEVLREAIRKNTWYDEDGNTQVNLYGIDNNLLNKQD